MLLSACARAHLVETEVLGHLQRLPADPDCHVHF